MPDSRSCPKLSPKLKPYFEQFSRFAKKSVLHPRDWGQFYEFISNAHGLRSKLTAMDDKHLPVNEGFGDKYASYLADVYSHGRDIIKVYRGSVPHGATDRWAT